MAADRGEPASEGTAEATDFNTEALARIVRDASEEELKAGLRENREPMIEEIFRRFPERLSDRGRREEAVIEWRIRRDDAEPDRWFVLIDRGECRTAREFDGEPRLRIEVGTLGFLKLVTGAANPVQMFMTGGLRIRGDLVLAARMQGLFEVPGG
jgi:putative sterol carrier protein